jgi:hypothetical protein
LLVENVALGVPSLKVTMTDEPAGTSFTAIVDVVPSVPRSGVSDRLPGVVVVAVSESVDASRGESESAPSLSAPPPPAARARTAPMTAMRRTRSPMTMFLGVATATTSRVSAAFERLDGPR